MILLSTWEIICSSDCIWNKKVVIRTRFSFMITKLVFSKQSISEHRIWMEKARYKFLIIIIIIIIIKKPVNLNCFLILKNFLF